MTEKKPTFNPQTVSVKKKKEKKETRPSLGRQLFSRKEHEDPSTRTIRFAPKTAQSVFSFLFFGLFLAMCVVTLLSFGRMDTLTDLALRKQVNKETLVSEVNQSVKDSDQLKYEGTRLADRLFTLSHSQSGREYWQQQMATYLVPGLSVDALGFDTVSADRIARTVRFIKMDTLNQKEAIYRLYYDVRFTEGSTWRQVQVSLPVSYEGKELKLLERPTITNLEQAKESNSSVYETHRFTPKGSEVPEEDKQKVTEFTQRFFELYVTNDEKLALITNEQGLSKATLQVVTVDKILLIKKGLLYVEGSYQFSFEKNSPFTSRFTLEIEPTKDSYFVTKMNEE